MCGIGSSSLISDFNKPAASPNLIPVSLISAIIQALPIAGAFITAAVFETAKSKPQFSGGLGRGNGGEHD
tara:strand:+ start:177 stop:386 length:210 start_codon:yes stop_codon:yes gene_type:complete